VTDHGRQASSASGATGTRSSRIEAAVVGNKIKDAGPTEKMAFFEALRPLAGESGIATSRSCSWPKGGLCRGRKSRNTRLRREALGEDPHAGGARLPVPQKSRRQRGAGARNDVNRALRDLWGAHDDPGGKAAPQLMETPRTRTASSVMRAGTSHRALPRRSVTQALKPNRECAVQKGSTDSGGQPRHLLGGKVEKEIEDPAQGRINICQLDAAEARSR